MIKEKLVESVILQQIDLFDPSKSYMNYSLASKSGETSINFNCVERYSDVCLGREFTKITLYDEEPYEKPPILSMKVKLVSAGSTPDGSEHWYKFEGISRPYSEVSFMSKHTEFKNVGRIVGESFYIGID